MFSVVVDTNVVISSIFWSGNSHKILKNVSAGKIQAFTSEEIVEELVKILSRFRYKLPKAKIAETVNFYLKTFQLISNIKSINAVSEDPDDNKFIECAVKAKVDYLITGDKHLLKLDSYREVKILTPSDFLKLFFKSIPII